MDARIFAGLPDLPNRIITCAKKYFNVTSLEGRSGNVMACKRVIIVLMRNMTDLRQEKIALKIGLTDHAIISYTIKNFAKDYYGQNEYCEFVYLNVKAMVEAKEYFHYTDVCKEALKNLPLSPEEKDNTLMYLKHPEAFTMIKNVGIRAFVVYLRRKSVTSLEIARTIGIPGKWAYSASVEIPHEKVFTEIISIEIQKVITKLKLEK